jgi:glycosyltransferase involved in cell wall biosynthesis
VVLDRFRRKPLKKPLTVNGRPLLGRRYPRKKCSVSGGGGLTVRALAFGTYDARVHPRVQVLIHGLRAHGVVVRELNAPLGLSTADRVRMLRQPWRLSVLAARLSTRWSALAFESLRQRRSQKPGFVLVGYLGHFDVFLARVLFPRTKIVLDHLIFASMTATDRGIGSRGRGWLLSALDSLALVVADVIVVDTTEHQAMVPTRLQPRSVVVPVGATDSWFDAACMPTDAGRDGPLSVVFFGLFTPLQGAAIIGRAFRELHHRGVEFRATLIGTGQDYAAVRDELAPVPLVSWQKWVDPPALPNLVAAHDVCLGIFGDTPKALSVVPNKVYQGAAAGCAIITSDTAPQRRLLQDAALLVPTADPIALADALEYLARNRTHLAELRCRARMHAEREFSAPSVVRSLLDALSAPPGADSRHGP